MHKGPVPTDGEDASYDDMLLFIMQCLPAAVSAIKADCQYDRVALLKKLLTSDKG